MKKCYSSAESARSACNNDTGRGTDRLRLKLLYILHLTGTQGWHTLHLTVITHLTHRQTGECCHVWPCVAPGCLTNLIIWDNLLTPFIGYWWSKSCQFSLMFFSPEKGTQYWEKGNNGTYIILGHCSVPAFVIFFGVNLRRKNRLILSKYLTDEAESWSGF